MKREQIILRDPFVLPYEDKYYLYGTRSFTCWGERAYGTDVYVSSDLENWSEPIEVFHADDSFWGKKCFWAPEVHYYEGAFYMFITFHNDKRCMGTAILKADQPEGPFKVHSEESITPREWECLDGSFYVSKDGTPYIVFCHEWKQIKDGTICAMPLSKDLKKAIGEPVTLFSATKAQPWIRPIDCPEYKDYYVTDGPYLHRLSSGKLMMIWSSYGENGYVQAMAYSDNGDVLGNWQVDERLLFDKDGGHGMLFKTFDGKLMLALHSPNDRYSEHPCFIELNETHDTIYLKNNINEDL